MFDDIPSDSVEGEMTITSSRKSMSQPGILEYNTLDEPIKETFVRFSLVFTYLHKIIKNFLAKRCKSSW